MPAKINRPHLQNNLMFIQTVGADSCDIWTESTKRLFYMNIWVLNECKKCILRIALLQIVVLNEL